MIHFNELYINEEGKNLVIDTAIDDMSVYDKCYIESISVASASLLCGDDKKNCNFIPMYTGGTGLTYVDMDGDGKITECDMAIVDRINSLISEMLPSEVNNKYDINGDGFIDLSDYACIIDAILTPGNANNYPNTPELDGDGEIGVGDANDWVDYVLRGLGKLTKEDREFIDGIFDEELGDYITDGALRTYTNLLKDPDSIKYISSKPQRHVRLCLSSLDLYGKSNQSLANDMFIVKVKAHVGGNVAEIAALGCGWDLSELTGAAYNLHPMYRNFISMADGYGDRCDSNMDSIVDFILRYNMFDYSLRIGNWCEAWKYYQSLNSGNSSFVSSGKNCGCHGIRW